MWLRGASSRLNSTQTTARASALHRVCGITRRTRLMRSQGCQRRASVSATSSSVPRRPRSPRLRPYKNRADRAVDGLGLVSLAGDVLGQHDLTGPQHTGFAVTCRNLRSPSQEDDVHALWGVVPIEEDA